MPVKMRRLKGGKVQVSTPGGVKAKATTEEKANKQKRLLNAIEHGWRPTRNRSKKAKRSAMPATKRKRT